MGTGTHATQTHAKGRQPASRRQTTKSRGTPTPAVVAATPPKRLLSVPEAAAELGIGQCTAWKLVAWGRAGRGDGLESITVGRSRKVPRVCLDRYIERRLGDGGMALAIA